MSLVDALDTRSKLNSSRPTADFSLKHGGNDTAIDDIEDLKRQIVNLKTQIYDYKAIAQRYKDVQMKCHTLEQLQHTSKRDFDEVKSQLQQKIAQHEEECEKRKTLDNVVNKTREQLDHMMQELTREHTARQKSDLNYKNAHEELTRIQARQKSYDVEHKDMQKQLEEERRIRGALETQLILERQKLRSSLRESQDEKILESSGQIEELYKRLRCDSAENLANELETYQNELHRTRNCLKEERKVWIEKNEELQSRIDQLEQEKKLNEEALEMASLSYNSEIINLYNELKYVQIELDKKHENEHVERIERHCNTLPQPEKQQQQIQQQQKKQQQPEPQQTEKITIYNEEWDERYKIREQELMELRDTNRSLIQKVTVAERRISSVELKVKQYENFASKQKELIKRLRDDLMQQIRNFEKLQLTKLQTDERNTHLQKQIQCLTKKFVEQRQKDNSFQQKFTELIRKFETEETQCDIVEDLRLAFTNYQKGTKTSSDEIVIVNAPPYVTSHSANKIDDLINHIDQTQQKQFGLRHVSSDR